jgi:hypothetical protein
MNLKKIIKEEIGLDWAKDWADDIPTVGQEYYMDYDWYKPVLIRVVGVHRTSVRWKVLDTDFLNDNVEMFWDHDDDRPDPFDSMDFKAFMEITEKKSDLNEGMDWIKGVATAIPDNSFLNKPVPVTLTVRDYLNSQYSYDFIDIIFNDGRVIELTMEGDWDVKYATYDSLWDLVETQGLSNPWVVEGTPTEFNQGVMEDYLREFSMEEVRPEVIEVLKKVIPLDIKGIYTGSL